MKSTQFMQYKNYYGSVNIDTENNLLYGKVEFIRAVITFEAKDAGGLVKAFHEAVNDYLAFCHQKKIEPEQPFKGSLNVRIGEARHRKAWLAAKSADKSINDYICQALDESFNTKVQHAHESTKTKQKKSTDEKRKSA